MDKGEQVSEKKPVYIGGYGFDPTVLPPEIEAEQADFIEGKLKEWVKLRNVNSWASERLRIIADMVDEGDHPKEWLVDQIREIQRGLS